MCSSTTRALREARPVSLQYEYKKVHRIENGECTGRCYIQKFTYTRPICLNLLCNGISAGFFMPVSVASSDGVTASPGSTQSDGTVLSAPADTAAAGAPADTRASPASPGSSASSHYPIRDMDFDNVPALRSLERPGSRALRAGAQRRAGGRPAQYLERAPADTSSAEGPHRAGLGLQDERQSGEAVAPLRGIACQGGCGCQGGCFVVRAERH